MKMSVVVPAVLLALCLFAVRVEAQIPPSPCGPKPYIACSATLRCTSERLWVIATAEPAGTLCSTTYNGPITATCVVQEHGAFVNAECDGPLPTYTLSVTVSGTVSGAFGVSNNNTVYPILGGGTVILSSHIVPPVKYNVEIDSQPAGGYCTPGSNNTGTITDANVNVAVTCALASPPGDVITYHYDSLRTGWNQNETKLTPANVQITSNCSKQSCFGLLYPPTALDEQVDAQPLVVLNQTIKGGVHDVVYVATENNSIYAIDAASGNVLLQQMLGPPVPQSSLPQGPYSTPWGPCGNNSSYVGIDSTPVIDLAANALYVITYNLNASLGPAYYLHALDLGTLAEKTGSPKLISATVTLADNVTSYSFYAAVQRQRPALLEANGNIYAGFGSFCDYAENQSRGWLLGWNASSLQPLAAGQLNNRLDNSSGTCTPAQLPCFLSSIWMSGYGPAADSSGSVFFVTGNSAPNTYGPNNNIQESVVKISSDVSTIAGIFTPFQPAVRDDFDNDFGSGGALLLPDQPGTAPHLAAAAGKDGNMYLLDRDSLGGLSANSSPSSIIGGTTVAAKQIAPELLPGFPNSHSGPSYFRESDGVGRVVSSGGSQAMVWKVVTSPSTAPSLQLDTSSAFSSPATLQDPGFFTTVSSNATQPGTAIIWAVQRPISTNNLGVSLYAFDPTKNGTAAVLLNLPSGTWPMTNGNANIVPVVSNGKVYVASYKQLAIFGLGATGTIPLNPPGAPSQPNGRTIYGAIVKVDGSSLSVKLRSGKVIQIDVTQADRRHRSVPAALGASVGVLGVVNEKTGVIQAQRTFQVESSPASWPADR